jgi:CBS domain-containing protein
MEKSTKTALAVVERKKTGIVGVAPGDSVLAALQVMAERNIGAVLVMESGRLIGILSERDCARKVELRGRSARDTTVAEIMTANVFCVAPGDTIEACRKLMGEKRIRHLPVVEDRRVIGVLSSRDVLEEVIAEDEKVIRQLETERLIATTDPGTY